VDLGTDDCVELLEEQMQQISLALKRKKFPAKKIRDMFPLFFGLVGGSANSAGRIFISTA
jgi:hypothetical protein